MGAWSTKKELEALESGSMKPIGVGTQIFLIFIHSTGHSSDGRYQLRGGLLWVTLDCCREQKPYVLFIPGLSVNMDDGLFQF